MFKQNDLDFPTEINKYGCYFLCLLRICEIEARKEFEKWEIVDLFAKAVSKKYIAAPCDVLRPDSVCKLATDRLSSPKTILQVGSIENGKRAFWGWANRAPFNAPQYIAQKFATGGPVGHHFVLTDIGGTILFDPEEHDYTHNKKLSGLLHTVL